MPNIIEVVRTFPLLALCLIALPVIGGLVGGYLGFDTLQQRVEDDRRHKHVDDALEHLKTPVETLRRYEATLSSSEQNTNVLRMIIRQYDQLRASIDLQSRFVGQENKQDRIMSADQIIENIRDLLGVTQTVPGPGGKALIIQTAPNTFRVLFAVPMRAAPNLEFRGLPSGVSPTVLEKTNVGFSVTFSPQSIPVHTFNFIANAEL
jgi:hypothetical protein